MFRYNEITEIAMEAYSRQKNIIGSNPNIKNEVLSVAEVKLKHMSIQEYKHIQKPYSY